MKALLAAGAGASLDQQDMMGCTALLCASQAGATESVKALLDPEAEEFPDLELRDNDGDTALLFACMEGHLRVLRMLLDAGADADARSDSGSSAYKHALTFGHSAVVRELEENGVEYAEELGESKQKEARRRVRFL